MINFNEHIEKELRNEYGGSEKKRTVIMDDGKKYLLKFPDPTREVGKRDKLSYINNALSEYIGCKIAKSMRLPVQEVILGTYDINGKTKIACACQDLRGEGEKLYEIEKLELGSVDDNNSITFEALEKIFGKIDGIDQDSIRKYYYDMFILDTLIGNKDRHNGNWGIIEDAYGNVRMAPIFDCGSGLYPLAPDEYLPDAKNAANGTYSAIVDEHDNRIAFHKAFDDISNQGMMDALKRKLYDINLREIERILDNIPEISDVRRNFYLDFIESNYYETLIPAMNRITELEFQPDQENMPSDDKLYEYYKRNIKGISELGLFEKEEYDIKGYDVEIMRVSKKYALIFDNEVCCLALPIRSNNREVCKVKTILSRFNDKYVNLDKNVHFSVIDNDLER